MIHFVKQKNLYFRPVINMSFGDWNMFRVAVTNMRELEERNAHIESSPSPDFQNISVRSPGQRKLNVLDRLQTRGGLFS